MTLEVIALVLSVGFLLVVTGLVLHAVLELTDPHFVHCHDCYRWTRARAGDDEPLCFRCRHAHGSVHPHVVH